MIGGFLGAGKTTAILRLADFLAAKGQRVGLITNDQSVGLVDTAMLASHGFPVEEITGGCFCCRFHSLTEAADRLAADETPEVFIAEPVGSCTDLRASVTYPLRAMYGDRFEVAPLSVLVDPVRAARVLGIEPGRSFTEKVLYVYSKQLEEADLIVINKTDLLDAGRIDALREALATRYRQAEVLVISARTGQGLESWFERILSSTAASAAAMDLDYEIYAEGEALLGWLNTSVRLSSAQPFDGNSLVQAIGERIHGRLARFGFEVAHLKMVLTPSEEAGDLAVANLVRSDGRLEFSHTLREPLDAGELLLNLRAEGDPDTLREEAAAAVESAAQSLGGVSAMIEHTESFRPAKPQPTYRLAVG
ncbi:MAG: cobalamin biosynthesis protein P47K [Acidobacteria bacterium]|nr:cobalamin biosynthesis protein P47K [Acidobacteriota bacterium]